MGAPLANIGQVDDGGIPNLQAWVNAGAWSGAPSYEYVAGVFSHYDALRGRSSSAGEGTLWRGLHFNAQSVNPAYHRTDNQVIARNIKTPFIIKY